jgi:adenylate dimethylallyltransferase
MRSMVVEWKLVRRGQCRRWPGRDGHDDRGMLVYLVIGPASVGKTTHAVSLARSRGGVVIALDRIQVFGDLATGSGRPLPEQVAGVTYWYVQERKLTDGELPLAEALTSVAGLLDRAAEQEVVVLEGGSVSLAAALLESDALFDHEVIVEARAPGPAAEYLPRLERRAMTMLIARGGRPSMAEELAFQHQAGACEWIGALDGYRAVLRWCEDRGVSPRELPGLLEDDRIRGVLARSVAREHYERTLVASPAFSEIVQRLQVRGVLTAQATTLSAAGVT